MSSLSGWLGEKTLSTKDKTDYKMLSELEKLGSLIQDAYFEDAKVKTLIGFLPLSVWCVTKGEWYRYLREYTEDPRIPVKRDGIKLNESREATRFKYVTSIRNPKIAERVYKLWSSEGDIVYNPFCGYGIDYFVAAKLKRHYYASDIDERVISLNRDFYEKYKHHFPPINTRFWVDDATILSQIKDESVDLIYTSPPYFSAEIYPFQETKEFSHVGIQHGYEEFLKLFQGFSLQAYRVLKAGKYAVVNVGDTRREREYYMLHIDTIKLFSKAGFKLYDIIIMVNITPYAALAVGRAFLKKQTVKVHEYILVFVKV